MEAKRMVAIRGVVRATATAFVGEVLAHRTDGSGTSLIELPSGGHLVASGQSVAVGQMAFVRAKKVEGQAPSLPR